MDTINQLSLALQVLLTVGCIARIIFCAIKLTHDEDEAQRYKKRIRNCIVIVIIGQLVFVVKDILTNYFGTGY